MKENKTIKSMITSFNAELEHEVEFGLEIDINKQAEIWNVDSNTDLKIWFLEQLRNPEFMKKLLYPGVMIKLMNHGEIENSKLKILKHNVLFKEIEDTFIFNAKPYLIETL